MGPSTRPRNSHVDQRIAALAAANLQLLALLDAVQRPGPQDAEYLMDAAQDTQALAVVVSQVERMRALDPGGLMRLRLRQAGERARQLYLTTLHRTRKPAGVAGMHARISIALNRLLQGCEQLASAIDRHDRPFDAGGQPDEPHLA